MSNDERPTQEELVEEQRSLTGAVIQSLNDVKQGAGWATGALLVSGAVQQGKQLLGKGKKED